VFVVASYDLGGSREVADVPDDAVPGFGMPVQITTPISNFVGKCSNSVNDRHRTEAFPG
jgi:hypothetical protein